MRRALAAAFVLALAGCESPAAPVDASAGDAGADVGSADVGTADVGAVDSGHDAASLVDAGPRTFGPAMALGTTPGATLPEISGIVASRTHPGVYWVENDSGNPAAIYAISGTGALLATITLTGTTNVDWEDIALAPGVSGDDLYVPDFGNNLARTSGGTMGRTMVRLYRLPEPDPAMGDRAITPEAIDVRWPTQPHDCEAVFVEAATGDLYVVSKEDMPPARVMVARAPLTAGTTATLEDLGSCDIGLATGADIRRDGTEIVLRNYAQIRVYDVVGGDIAASLASTTFTIAPSGSAAEAVCFDHDDRDLLTIAEGAGATLFRVPRR